MDIIKPVVITSPRYSESDHDIYLYVLSIQYQFPTSISMTQRSLLINYRMNSTVCNRERDYHNGQWRQMRKMLRLLHSITKFNSNIMTLSVIISRDCHSNIGELLYDFITIYFLQ